MEDNPLVNTPHTQLDLTAGSRAHPYSREIARIPCRNANAKILANGKSNWQRLWRPQPGLLLPNRWIVSIMEDTSLGFWGDALWEYRKLKARTSRRWNRSSDLEITTTRMESWSATLVTVFCWNRKRFEQDYQRLAPGISAEAKKLEAEEDPYESPVTFLPINVWDALMNAQMPWICTPSQLDAGKQSEGSFLFWEARSTMRCKGRLDLFCPGKLSSLISSFPIGRSRGNTMALCLSSCLVSSGNSQIDRGMATLLLWSSLSVTRPIEWWLSTGKDHK